YHKETTFLPICPVFMQYDKPRVFSGESYSSFFRQLMYYFCQIQTYLGYQPSERLPPAVADLEFNQKWHFEEAIKNKQYFRSEMTPHSTRATVISEKSLILPAQIIGKEISGHIGEDLPRYYTVVNSDYI